MLGLLGLQEEQDRTARRSELIDNLVTPQNTSGKLEVSQST